MADRKSLFDAPQAGPREHRCHCGKVAAYGMRDVFYCREHRPPEWFEIGAQYDAPVELADF